MGSRASSGLSAIPIEAMLADAHGASDIVAPQHDAIPGGDRYRFAVEHPDCFVNVTLSVRDFPDPSPSRRAVVRRAKRHFEEMLERCLFEPLSGKGFLLYELDTGRHRQLGIVAGVPVAAVREGRVIGHEGTLDDRVDDLARFMCIARLASSPVSLGFRADTEQLRLMEDLASREPIRDFTGMDGVRQRLWTVAAPTDIVRVEAAIARAGPLYITDGHHRVAASSREGVGPGWFLAILFPTDHLAAVEYNRLIRMDRVPEIEEVGRLLRPDWTAVRIGAAGRADARPRRRGELSMLHDGTWYRLRYRGKRPADPVAGLDVSLLHESILGPVFGMASDQDRRLAYVIGGESLAELERQTAVYPGGVGFAMRPAGIEEVTAVADAGRLMPPKSTWFTPKPRSGLFVVRWDRAAVARASRTGPHTTRRTAS